MLLHVIQAIKDKDEALKFIETMMDKVKASDESVILLTTEAGRVHLQVDVDCWCLLYCCLPQR